MGLPSASLRNFILRYKKPELEQPKTEAANSESSKSERVQENQSPESSIKDSGDNVLKDFLDMQERSNLQDLNVKRTRKVPPRFNEEENKSKETAQEQPKTETPKLERPQVRTGLSAEEVREHAQKAKAENETENNDIELSLNVYTEETTLEPPQVETPKEQPEKKPELSAEEVKEVSQKSKTDENKSEEPKLEQPQTETPKLEQPEKKTGLSAEEVRELAQKAKAENETENNDIELSLNIVSDFMKEYKELASTDISGKMAGLYNQCEDAKNDDARKSLIENFLKENNINELSVEDFMTAYNSPSGQMKTVKFARLANSLVHTRQEALVKDFIEKYDIKDIKPSTIQNYMSKIGGVTAEDLYNQLKPGVTELRVSQLEKDLSTISSQVSIDMNMSLTYSIFSESDSLKKDVQNLLDSNGITDITAEELIEKYKNGDTADIENRIATQKKESIVSEFIAKYDAKEVIDIAYKNNCISVLGVINELNVKDMHNANPKYDVSDDDIKSLYKDCQNRRNIFNSIRVLCAHISSENTKRILINTLLSTNNITNVTAEELYNAITGSNAKDGKNNEFLEVQNKLIYGSVEDFVEKFGLDDETAAKLKEAFVQGANITEIGEILGFTGIEAIYAFFSD